MWYNALIATVIVLSAYIGIGAVASEWPVIGLAYSHKVRVVIGIILGGLLYAPMAQHGKVWGIAAFPIAVGAVFLLSWIIPWIWKKLGTLVKVIVIAVIVVAVIIVAVKILNP